jgi:hypothetical protein
LNSPVSMRHYYLLPIREQQMASSYSHGTTSGICGREKEGGDGFWADAE